MSLAEYSTELRKSDKTMCQTKCNTKQKKTINKTIQKKQMKCNVFLIASTMIATTEGTENMTHTYGRTEKYGIRFINIFY